MNQKAEPIDLHDIAKITVENEKTGAVIAVITSDMITTCDADTVVRLTPCVSVPYLSADKGRSRNCPSSECDRSDLEQ